MRERFRRLLAAIAPQEVDLTVPSCGAQIICLVMVWFFVQGSGGVAFSDATSVTPVGDSAHLRLLNLGTQCAGGVIGSLIVFFRGGRGFRARSCRTAPPMARRTVLAYVAVLALSLAASLGCAMAGLPLVSAALRMVACSLITLLFLEVCLVLVGLSLRTVLAVFLLVALCRIVQNIIMLPFALEAPWAILSTVAELVLLGIYTFIVVRWPGAVPSDELAERTDAGESSTSGETTTLCEESPTSSGFGGDFCEGHESRELRGGRDARWLPWQFIVHVMLYYFVIGVLRLWEGALAAPGLPINCAYLIASAVSFILFYASFVRTGNTRDYWARIRQIVFPLLVASCAMTGLLEPGLLLFAVVLGQAAYRFFLLASYVEMFFVCSITDMSARHVFSITHLVMYIGMFAGGVLGLGTRDGIVGSPSVVLGITLLVFLCLTAASCWLGNDRRAGKVWGRRIELTPKGRQEELLSETCQIIADTYYLTAKERETLEHLVRNQSLDQIAETLVVSKNTVRTHVRNLYAKIGAHSRSDVCHLYDTVRASMYTSAK